MSSVLDKPVKDLLHSQLLKNLDEAGRWFANKKREIDIPFYSSFDIRDSGFKVATVDGNIYPAGFNNICPTDREHAPPLVRYYLDRHYGKGKIQRLMILTEEHTNNAYYWENVYRLAEIIRLSGVQVAIAIPRLATETAVMKTASGFEVEVVSAQLESGKIKCPCESPDLIVSNNDFSDKYEDWSELRSLKINPPHELGWWQRKKSNFFFHYNQLANEFSKVIGVDPWLLRVETELFASFDMANDESRSLLAERVDKMLMQTRQKYSEFGIQADPFVFVKNNSGTYGLGVMRVGSAEDILNLNYKTRKKMKAAKGGREVEEVIVQEGIPSIVRADGVTAEPTIYMFGCQLGGGFLRSHSEKDPTESLNSPGAVYKRLCVSDLEISVEGHPLENVYGWISRLGVLAIGQEAKQMGAVYRSYQRGGDESCELKSSPLNR